jgi:hypothetical protein
MMKKLVPILEGILQAFVALSALIGGMLLMVISKGSMLKMSISMPEGIPFVNPFWPGLILFAVIGCGHAMAAVLSFRRRRLFGLAGAVLGLGLMTWIFVEVSLRGAGHWLQYLYFGLGTAEVYLAVLQLGNPGKKGGSGDDA